MNFAEFRISSTFVTRPEIPEVWSEIQFQNEDMSFQVTRFQVLLIIWPQHLSCLMLYIPKYLGSVRELELRGPAPWSGWLQNIYSF